MTAGLIKGYLPVRVRIGDEPDTFFYIKEHQTHDSDQQDTLFVANAPSVPSVPTRALLRSLIGRYADVRRVIVVGNPRQSQATIEPWTKAYTAPSYLASAPEGMFAHVVLSDAKACKKCLKALSAVANEGLTVEKIEIQALADDDTEEESKTGILAVASRYRHGCDRLSTLMDECNAVMAEYEEKEEADRRTREASAAEPDDDGFVTVTYGSQVGSQKELDTDASHRRSKGQRRSRKKKKRDGPQTFDDFYRFQTKVNRKRSLHELRQRFEEDIAKVKRMKEERQYRPF